MIAEPCVPGTEGSATESTPIIRLPTATDHRTSRGRPSLFIIGCVLAVLMHIYAGVLLTTVFDVTVEEGVPDHNLANDEIGNDPDLPTNYNVDRIEDIDIPGPVNPNELPGTAGAPNAPPPRFGANMGLGGEVSTSGAGQTGVPGSAGSRNGGAMPAPGLVGRSGATRERLLVVSGCNSRSDCAVSIGRKWLACQQAPDGAWRLPETPADAPRAVDVDSRDVLVTALALLPFLGAGETHKPGRHSPHAKNLEAGLKFLLNQQQADGLFNSDVTAHALATLVVCEAYGLTADIQLKGPAQRALNAAVAAQHRGDGGWAPQVGAPSNTFVTGWTIQALKSGQMAALSVPNATWSGSSNFLDAVASADGSAYGYENPQPTPRMTAIGLQSRMYMGWGPRHPGLQKGIASLVQQSPASGGKDICHSLHVARLLSFAACSGEEWDRWWPRVRDQLCATQDDSAGPQQGSWCPENDAWGDQVGRLGITALTLLTLQAPPKRLPLYRRDLASPPAASELAGIE